MIRKLLLPFLLAFTIPASADLPGLTAPARFGYDVPCRASLGKRGIPTTKPTMKTKANHMWWGRFAAVAAAALVSFLALPAGAAYAPATVSTTGSSVTTTILPDQSTVVTFLADGTFTVPDGATARVLLVGGGGAGGYDIGGGGGAGGMLESNAVVLAAGTYTVAVGAGGQTVNAKRTPGGNGGDTVLSLNGEELAKALGGGGGGAYFDSKAHGADAAAGGSGGGSGGATSPNFGVGGSGTIGQGQDGAENQKKILFHFRLLRL